MKKIVSLNRSNHTVPITITKKEKNITYPEDIANSFKISISPSDSPRRNTLITSRTANIGEKVKHELRVQIHKLRVQIYELRVQIYELKN